MTTLREAMTSDHRRLEQTFERFLEAMHADDREGARAAWTELERGLSAHLAAEESGMIPAIQETKPDEAAALLAEHAEIRSLLAELGVSLDLHVVREDTARAFVQRLRDHAKREDGLLYAMADRALLPEQKQALLARIGHVLDRLAAP